MSITDKNGRVLLSQQEIISKYDFSKLVLDKYLPKPVVKSEMGQNGKWKYERFWYESDVEQALKNPKVIKKVNERKEYIKKAEIANKVKLALLEYNPENMIERAKNLKRAFVLHVGPTNSGKTYTAIKALKENGNGIYLGPLRLLALEMYDRINADGIKCSLLTGEESLPVEGAEIVSSTIELCNFKKHFKVAVIDEAQLITDRERGSAWFKAVCQVDADEVHICMAPEAEEIITELVSQFGDPYTVVMHERLVPLVYSGKCRGYKDIHDNDAIICFSRKNVLSTAALLEKKGFKASVIYGALPPAARRNEVQRYVSGETNIVVATDAIGMGISLPIRRIIFAETQKFDGKERRFLTPAEVRQIAGRAGRYNMFDLGEVLTMDSNDIVEKGLERKVKSVKKLCISFPREMLLTEYPIETLLGVWQNLPENKIFSRENMQDPLILWSMLKKYAGNTDRELLFDLITCPVDTKQRELTLYWLNCAVAIISSKPIPEPCFGTTSLAECEMQYKAYDIHHLLLRTVGIDDDCSYQRDMICHRIDELMKQDKSSYIKRCSSCGKELPLGFQFNMCEKCYSMQYFYNDAFDFFEF